MIKQMFHAVRNATFGFIIGIIAYWGIQLLWWEFYPYKTADVEVPIAVANEGNIVRRGEKLEIIISFNKQTDVSPLVTRALICNDNDSYFISVQDRTSSRPRGKFVGRASFDIPPNVPMDSNCIFEFTNIYQVNPIRTITKKWASEPFTIKE